MSHLITIVMFIVSLTNFPKPLHLTAMIYGMVVLGQDLLYNAILFPLLLELFVKKKDSTCMDELSKVQLMVLGDSEVVLKVRAKVRRTINQQLGGFSYLSLYRGLLLCQFPVAILFMGCSYAYTFNASTYNLTGDELQKQENAKEFYFIGLGIYALLYLNSLTRVYYFIVAAFIYPINIITLDCGKARPDKEGEDEEQPQITFDDIQPPEVPDQDEIQDGFNNQSRLSEGTGELHPLSSRGKIMKLPIKHQSTNQSAYTNTTVYDSTSETQSNATRSRK